MGRRKKSRPAQSVESKMQTEPAWKVRALGGALMLAVFVVYWGTLSAPFHFDDFYRIVEDTSMHHLWPPGGSSNRPVLNLSLAINYVFSGESPQAFRLTNIVLHACSALLLFGVVRRTLHAPRFESRLGSSASLIAFSVALLWALHPLHTQAVTYIWQRSESMMGLFFLATLYCTVRLAEGQHRRRWGVAAILALFAGLGTKEVMVTVVPVLIAYDGVLLAPSVREALRKRWRLYGTMCMTLLLATVAMMLWTQTTRGAVSAQSYAASQAGIVIDYLRLALWPFPQCFDYAREPVAGFADAALPLSLLALFAAASLWGLRKRAWWGVAGFWFFVVLAPTSSVVPINDLMVEYRMYLPLAGVVAVVLGVGHFACRRLHIPGWLPVGLLALALGARTIQRNRVYDSNLALWRSVVETAPDNSRGHDMLGVWCATEGLLDEAEEHGRRAVKLDKRSVTARWNLGTTLGKQGNLAGALLHYRAGLKIDGSDAWRYAQKAELQSLMGDLDGAERAYRRSIELAPEVARTHVELATTLHRKGARRRALAACDESLALDANQPSAWRLRGDLLAELGELSKALEAMLEAVRLAPRNAAARFDLGKLQIVNGELSEALATLDVAMALEPRLIGELATMSVSIVSSSNGTGERQFALALCVKAAERSRRRDAQVLESLARVHGVLGDAPSAAALLDETLRLPSVASDPAYRQALELQRDLYRAQ